MASSSDEDDDRAPRSWVVEERVKRVRKLPIKQQGGSIIPQDEKLSKPVLSTPSRIRIQEDVESEGEEEEEDQEPLPYSTQKKTKAYQQEYEEQPIEEEEEKVAPKKAMSVEEQLQTIARWSTAILAGESNSVMTEGVKTNAKGEAVAPEKSALDQLMHFATRSSSVWIVRKAAWLSILAVFKDLLPWEYVRELTDKELHSKATKETRLQRNTEKVLLTTYKHFVTMLLDEQSNSVATYCLCHLLEARGVQFNFADQILAHVLFRSNAMCLASLARILDDDMSFESTLVILKRIGRIYEKKSSKGVSAPLLLLFSKLRLNLDLKDEKRMGEIEKAKKYRQDKKRRLGADLNKLLEETDTSSTRNHEMHQRQMEIIRELFTLYLRILTTRFPSNAKRAPLTIVALRGARRLVQLVNIEFIHGIVRLLSTFVFEDGGEEGSEFGFDVVVALETCETGLTALGVLARPELRQSKVECDEDYFTMLLARCLGRIRTPVQMQLVYQCAQLLFFRRREGDPRVVGDFCKAIVGCGLHLQDCGVVLGLITLQRQLVEKYPGVKDMLFGSKIREEESCGPLIPVAGISESQSSATRKAWELDLLAGSHFDIAIKRTAQESRVQRPTTKKPVEEMEEHDSVNGVLFHPFVLPSHKSSSSSSSNNNNNKSRAKKPHYKKQRSLN
ncbi:hypothetical protein BASA81_003555 [Batrachochytrium salamandrivorans]|nr:hypothetical protein BASA81_003555 [Batrachochytrium salamandrivorans]